MDGSGPIENKVEELLNILRDTDSKLRKLEKSAKFLTQHAQTAVLVNRRRPAPFRDAVSSGSVYNDQTDDQA